MHRSLLISLALSVFVIAAPTAAHAAYPVGDSPAGVLGMDPISCVSDCTLLQDRYANADLRVPPLPGTDRGVITRWLIRAQGGSARLRRLSASNAAGLGATAWSSLAATDATQEFAARLPVVTGDMVAIDLTAGATVVGQANTLGGYEMYGWAPPIPNGAAPGAPADVFDGYIAYQAFVEPDVDADGLGDESQDGNVVRGGSGGGGGGGGQGSPPPGDEGQAPPPDPYASIRKAGPKLAIARSATIRKGVVAITATNPYAFPIRGSMGLKSGKKVAGKAKLKLGANGRRVVKVKLKRPYSRRRKLTLTATATMKGPVGKARRTTRKIKVSAPKKKAPRKPSGGGGGIDGTYRGDGLRADWVMAIRDGVVSSFNGTTNLSCAKSGKRKKVSFAMVGDDPKPRVAANGSFRWEATKGYGFTKLKFDGKVSKDGTVSASMMVEDRSPITGADPITGMPRIEFDYCFVGEKFTLRRKR